MAENEPVKYSKLYTPEMKTKTQEVHLMARKLDQYNVMAIAQVGKKLQVIKGNLEHGEWLQWLAESPTFGERSAQRAMALAEWSVSHATYFKKWADLGPTKLEILKSLPDNILKALAARKTIPIPGSDTPKTLYDMTAFEMTRLIRQYIKPAPVSLETEVKNMKSLVRKSIRTVHGLLPRAKKMDAEELIAVEREVTRLLKELREIRKNING